jgi:pyruvate/2-oxoglutarate dehydrogenase complex dihydrolipoamide dehydrogenase (E3) component
MNLELGATVIGLERARDEISVPHSDAEGRTRHVVGSYVLAALGRTPNTEDLISDLLT